MLLICYTISGRSQKNFGVRFVGFTLIWGVFLMHFRHSFRGFIIRKPLNAQERSVRALGDA